MKGKYINFTICSLTLFFLIEMFDHTNLIINTFYETTILWFYNLVPTLFPFLIITDILKNYGLVDTISKYLGKTMKLFNLKEISSYPLFMSLFSGFPGNSKLIKDLLDNNNINEIEANKLLIMNHFANPLFIVGTVGLIFLNNKKLGILILICHFITNFIIGVIFRNLYKNKYFLDTKNYTIKQSFMKTLSTSINNSINTLFLVYGIILFFALLVNILSINFNISPFNKAILTSFLEITQGLKEISNLNISYNIKATLMTFFISFGSLSIHMQVISILANYKIKYSIYFFSRLLHAGISSLLIYILLLFI